MMMRRFGNPPERGAHYPTRHGAYAIICAGDELLITWQDEADHEFQLPGGGIDADESPLAALHREVAEETGWRILVERRLGVFQRYAWMPGYETHAHKICHIYLARPTLQLGPPTEPGHIAVWMPARQAAAMLAVEGDRHFVRGLFRLSTR